MSRQTGGALLLALLLAGCGGAERPGPNIVLIVLDTLRADRLTCRGGPESLTPNLDAWCARSVVFTHASSTSSWTLPAHASLFTGLLPLEHGATQEHTQLSAGAATLAELLGARGYRAMGVSSNPLVSVKSGLARGFDEFVEAWRKRSANPFPAPQDHPNYRAVANLLGGLPASEPFFLFVNYIEAHGPNDPPEPYRTRALAGAADRQLVERAIARGVRGYYLDPASISPAEFALLRRLYDAEVAYLDTLVGGLLADLETQGRLEDTVVLLTSDHGENLGEHGHFRHVFSLSGSSVRIPLQIRLPGDARAGEVRGDPVGLPDLFVTVLSLAGVAAPSGLTPGRDLFAPGAAEARVPLVAEYYYPLQALGLFPPEAVAAPVPQLAPYLRRLRSIEFAGLRFVWSSDGRHELFDVKADPGENHNLARDPDYAAAAAQLLERLEALVAAAGGEQPLPEGAPVRGAEASGTKAFGTREPGGAFEDLDSESAELLRKLGYLPD